MIGFCKIFYVSFIELLIPFYFLYRYFMGSDPERLLPLSFQYVFVDGLTALECPKTGLALSVTRKSLFVISAAVLPSFFGAKAAFFAEPVADGISSVLSTIVFLLLINRHLDKRCRMDKKESL